MISFIIIGMNEAKTIKKTIDSIYTYVYFNKINAYEIIYVDSKSTDDSISIVKNFKEVKIFEITGEINAAIGRNIGAEEAKGDVLVFLDADMEIDKIFHSVIFKNDELIYPFVSGQLKNIFYNSKNEIVDENFLFPNLNNDTYAATTGGYFIIEKKLWDSVYGMKTKYRRSQDLDLGLRLAKKETLLLRKKELFVKHHTIHYQNKARMWKMLFDGSFLYGTSVLYRDHIFNKHIFKIIIRKDYTFIVLLATLLLSFLFSKAILFYPLILMMRVTFQAKVKQNANFIKNYIFLMIKDIMLLFGFIAFFPKSQELEYKRVQ